MKVVVLGGASFSTPALFAALHGDFAGCEFALVARSASNLAAVARASLLVVGDAAPRISQWVCDAGSSGPALEGAAVVLVQMRIGNLPGRAFDEGFPLEFGLCGDEGLGAGGVSAAWRSWPQIEPWLEAIRRHAPRALVLMMASPVGILTRAAHVRFPDLDCLGICEVPFVALRDLCSLLEVDFASISFDYFGVNHLGWLHGVTAAARDLAREWADAPGRRGFPSAEVVHAWGGIPMKYLRLQFDAAAALSAQRATPIPRARELESLQRAALALYATASEREVRQSLARRDTPWYADAIVPLLRGLQDGDAPGPFFLSGPNRGWTGACADDDILEIGCRVRDGRIERIAQNQPPSPRIIEFVRHLSRHERVATWAVLERDRRRMMDALRMHPWVDTATALRESLPAILTDTIVRGNAALR